VQPAYYPAWGSAIQCELIGLRPRLKERSGEPHLHGAGGPWRAHAALERRPTSERRLAAKSALYCRVYTEGLFGIRPTGLRAFTLTPRLPDGWPEMQLKNARAFGQSFDIRVKRAGEKQRVEVVSGGRAVFSNLISGGESASVRFAE
jgi:hypothetical protein